jgi:hypothetical protein
MDPAVAGAQGCLHRGEASLFERKVKVQMQLFGHNQEEVCLANIFVASQVTCKRSSEGSLFPSFRDSFATFSSSQT